MTVAVNAERWFLAHKGQLLQAQDRILFAVSDLAGAESHYAVDESYGPAILTHCLSGLGSVKGLRGLLEREQDDDDYARLARAAQLATWDDQNRFCGRCRSALAPHTQDVARQCPDCSLVLYPRISP